MARALAWAGGEAVVAKVAMKPVLLGRVGRAIHCGLPGTPLSAFVGWTLFGAPAAEALAGRPPRDPGAFVRAGFALDRRPGRCEFRPARRVGPVADRFSHSLAALVAADGLMVLPAEAERIAQGDILRFLPL